MGKPLDLLKGVLEITWPAEPSHSLMGYSFRIDADDRTLVITAAEKAFTALEQQEKTIKELREALEHIKEYWNGDENHMAMSDALSEILATTEQALKGTS